MRKCRWCEDRVEWGQTFCDDLCRQLYQAYWAGAPPASQYANGDRAKRDVMSKANKVRSG
jgi:hypothetical protein